MNTGKSRSATQALTRRRPRPRFKFDEMGIPTGSMLLSTVGATAVTVCSSTEVQVQGMPMSLTAATRKLINDFKEGDHAVRYWEYKGRTILDIYNDTYPVITEQDPVTRAAE